MHAVRPTCTLTDFYQVAGGVFYNHLFGNDQAPSCTIACGSFPSLFFDRFDPVNSFPGNGQVLIGQFSTADGTAVPDHLVAAAQRAHQPGPNAPRAACSVDGRYRRASFR